MVVDPIPASGPALKPPPTIPAFISQQKQQSSETFKEAQAKEWDSKIKNIMSLLHAREQLVSFERSNTISARFVGTTPESIAKIKGLKQEIETLHTKLAESDSWPPAPTSSRSTFEADVMKMTEALKAVDATATKLDALMRELSSSDSMEVDGDEARPLKRRRVENTGPSYSQVKQLHHTVATYRERLDRLDNDVHAQYEDLKEYLTKEFEDKLIARENEPQVFPGLARLERSEGAIIKMDESLTEVATEMTSMLDQGNNMRLSVENTRSALVTAQSQISTLRADLQRLEENHAQDIQEIDALKAAVAAYMTRPPTPPPPPVPLKLLLEHMQEPLRHYIHEEIQSRLSDEHEYIRKSIQQLEQDTFGTVWEKLEETLALIKTIHARMKVNFP